MYLKYIFMFVIAMLFMHNSYAISSASVSTQAPVNFGVYSPHSPNPSDTIGRFVITCFGDASVNYNIALNSEKHGIAKTRQMKNGDAILNYTLYTNPARTLAWGDGANGTSTINANSKCSNGGSSQHIIYARIPAGQKNISVGTYSDTIMMSLDYQ